MEAVVEEESVYEQSQMSMIKSDDEGYRGFRETELTLANSNNNTKKMDVQKSTVFFLDEREQEDYESLEQDSDEDEYCDRVGTTMIAMDNSDRDS